MRQLSVPRDIEDLCIARINQVFSLLPETSAISVGTRIPVDESGNTEHEFVRLMAANGRSQTPVTTSWTITVEGWARSETRAARLMALAVSALETGDPPLLQGKLLGGAGNDPDPDHSDMSRYSALVSIQAHDSILTINQ
jgi:hypothetical protein